MILPNDFAKTVEKSDKGEEKHGRRKQYEKDGYNSSWPYASTCIGLSGHTSKSSLGGHYYDETTFLPLQYGHQPGGSPV